MKNILVVFNNNSGKEKALDYKKVIFKRLQELEINFKFVYINILPLIKNIDKYDTIIAVGGDGTVLSVLPYVVNKNKKFGIIPCGTANLFAEGLFIPKDVDKALDIIFSKKTSKVDIGKANNQFFSLRVGFGYDAEIINNTKRSLKRKIGYLAYLLQGIISTFKLSRKTYKVKIDDKEFTISANSIIVSNAGNMFKNFFTVAPKGALNDGKLDVFILCAKNIKDFIEIFFQIIFKRHKENSKVVYTQASNISIQTNDSPFHIDGEKRKLGNILNIQIMPKAVTVLVP